MARTNEKYLATVGYVNDPRGAQQFVESSGQVQAALQRTETELGDLGPSAAGSVRRLTAEMDRGQDSIEALHKDVVDYREELERLDTLRVAPVIDTQLTPAAQRYRDELTGGGRGGSGGGFFNNLENFGERSSALAGGLGGGEIGNAAAFLGDLGAAARTLNPAALALTATLGVGVAAFSAYNEQLTKNIEKANTYGEALSAAFLAGSTAQIEALAEQAREQINNATATRNVLKEQADAAQDQLAQSLDNASDGLANWLTETANGIFGTNDPALYVLDTTTSMQGYNESIAAQDLIIQNAQISLDAYTRVLASNENQAADNAAAFDTLVNAGQGVLDLIQRNLVVMQEESTARQREITEKTKLIQVTEEAAEATRRAAQATAITEATTQLFDVRADLSEKTNDLAEKEAALAKVTADATAKIAQLEADAGERRNEAIAKSNDDIEKQEQEHKDRIADIDRKANADIQNAIGRRDALAAFQAAQERKEQITDEVDSNRKRKQELQKSLDDQLNAIRTNLRKQTEAVRTNAANEETIKRQARDASRVALQNAQNAEVLLTKQFYTTQQNSLVTNYQQQLAIHEAGMIKIKDGIVRQYQDALQWGGGKTPSTNNGDASGKGFVAPYTAANVPALNININGATQQQVVRTTRTQVRNDLGRIVGMLPIQD